MIFYLLLMAAVCDRPPQIDAPMVACFDYGVQAVTPDGTAYVIPSGTHFGHDGSVAHPQSKTLAFRSHVFSNGFE